MFQNLGKSLAPLFAVLVCLSPYAARQARALDNPSFLYPADTLPKNFVVDENFSSSLPILVFLPEGGRTPARDQDIRAELRVYCEPEGNNSLRNRPTVSVQVAGRPIRGDADDAPGRGAAGSSRARRESARAVSEEKRSYYLDLVQPAADVSLAGLPADAGWVLHGSLRDKGMLRTALAHELGGILFPDAVPAAGVCEVLLFINGAYQYWGIHILGQNAEKLNIGLAAGTPDPILLRYAEAGLARAGDRSIRAGNAFYLAVPTGADDIELSQSRRRRIGVELEKVESALRSVSPGGFLAYHNYLDEKSAIDFFILSTLMLNAFDRTPPFYLLLDEDGKFRFIPDWRFEPSLDNAPNRDRPLPVEREMFTIEPPSPLARRELAWRILESGGSIMDLRIFPAYEAFDADNFIWIDRLFMSRSFVEGVHSRLNSLRQSALSPDNVPPMVNNLSARLGGAMERDWVRWRKEYAAITGPYALSPFVDEDGGERVRQTWSHDQELVKISHCLGGQITLLLEGFEELNWMSGELFDGGSSGTRQGAYSFAMLAGLFLLSYTFTRRL